ncbi:uncharacterized protein LOC141791805 [Halichoeres trimaculatus]|uniref:uncharacterized protein LOC141791805 n=1 Tax=Halichoeres trimaculatus TaxID=147232 RepID=UPI003D9E4F7A
MDQLQPLDQIGSGAETLGNCRPVFGTRYEYRHGKLPPISTFLKQPQLHRHTQVRLQEGTHSRDWTRSETVLSGSQGVGENDEDLPPGVGEVHEDFPQVTGRQYFQQPFTGGSSRGQESQDPIPPTLTSANGSSGEQVTSSGNQLKKKDQFPLKFSKNSGYIKRPMNAYLVWSRSRRSALIKQNPGAKFTDISIYLGNEWSKLSEEERSPYFEMARKLKQLHQQKFPDYEYRPLLKKNKLLYPPRQSGGQSTTVSTSRPNPPYFKFQGPSTNAWPAMMPYMAGYCFCPSFYQYIPVDPYYSGNTQSARVFSRFPNIFSTMNNEASYHKSHPQVFESNLTSPYYHPTTKQQDHCMACHHREYMTGSTSTDSCTSQQLSANNTMDCGNLDVVGLL